MSFFSIDNFCYTSALLLVFSGITGAAVRWFHMCRPYDECGGRFYPARRLVSAFYAGNLLLLPYLFDIGSESGWMLARSFGIIYCPAMYAAVGFKYFAPYGGGHGRWINVSAWLSVGFVALLSLVALLAVAGFAVPEGAVRTLGGIAPVFGILSLSSLAWMSWWLKRLIDRYCNENYSNTDDFPRWFARVILYPVAVWMLLLWGVYMLDNPAMTSCLKLIYMLMLWIYLIVILHPQRSDVVDEINRAAREAMEVSLSAATATSGTTADRGGVIGMAVEPQPEGVEISPELSERLLDRLEEAFVADRIYLNPNLTLQDVADHIGTNRTYASALIVRHHGSFITYVNRLRIEHALKLRQGNPAMTVQELFSSSGFNTRTSYLKWLKEYLRNADNDA